MKEIKGYEGLYAVSSCGRVWSYAKGRFLTPYLRGHGYLTVKLFKNGKGKPMYVHRLVAEAFIPNPNNYNQINHINEIKTDNYISNLEWCDCQKNIDHSISKKVMCVETGIIYKSIIEASRQTKVPFPNIWYCCNGERKTAGNYHWRKVD